MTGQPATISDEWIDALCESLRAFGALVAEQPVVDAWSEDSGLDGYTVGGLAGHVLSLMLGLRQRIEDGASEVEAIPYTDWYGSALSSSEVHSGLIRIGEQLASTGPVKVAADLAAVREQLARHLQRTRPDVVVPLASVRGAGVRLDDFVRTRFVEITVHAEDIAASVGVHRPDFPALAWTLAAGVVAETTRRPGSGADFVLASSRPNRLASDHRPTDT